MLFQRSLKDAPKASFADLFQKGVRPALIVGITLAVFQQLCGINVVFNYTSTIFESIGADLDRQLMETVTIGIVNLIFTIVAMWQVDKLGRRPLMLIGSLGLSVTYIAWPSYFKMARLRGLCRSWYWQLSLCTPPRSPR
jgi:SP family xylose:H+ symportor-like MFS transporter